jgi:hypothetical protein
MKPRTRILVGLIPLMMAISPAMRATEAGVPAAAAPMLYVAIDYVDERPFEEGRYSRVNGQEIILTTMRERASELAKAAHWPGPVTILDVGAKAPAGARVLTMLWDRGEALISDGPKSYFLGVVTVRPLAFHPDYKRISKPIFDAGLMRDAKHDALLRAHTEMSLFVALQLAAEHDAKK